jgi:predicted AlkP superfamily phosphohydrolase/phosphomutase
VRKVVAAALLLVLSCGRGREKPARPAASAVAEPPPVESADVATRARRAEGSRQPVIWLGLDGLDREILDRLSAKGRMPNWTRLAAEGYSAPLTAFLPILSPVIWTTVATGVGPDVHRVLDFQEVDPKTGQKVPISGLSRAVPAVWNLASAAGRKVGVVGWWATHPAEEVEGFFVSDHASPILYDKLSLSGVAYPPALEAGVAQIVERDGHPTPADLARFVDLPPAEIARILERGQDADNRIVALSRIVAATRVYHRAARDLYDKNLPDLMMIYIEGTDEIGHFFAPFTEPRLSCVSDGDFALYHRAVETYYAMVDQMLGQWMRRAAEDRATLIVHSDHGFKWGADRPCERSSTAWATAGFWHRLDGVFAAWGEAVKPGKGTEKPTMFDVAPTVLALLGAPRDRRMSGRAIVAAFRDLVPSPRSDLFPSLTVRRVFSVPPSEAEASEYAKKLLALGYLSGSDVKPLAPPGGDRPGMTEGAWNNLGLYFRETQKNLAAASDAFAKSLALSPGYHSPMFNLAVVERTRGHWPAALDWLFRSLSAGHAEPEKTLLQWSAAASGAHRRAVALAILERGVERYPASEDLALGLARLRFEAKDCAGAAAALRRFEESGSRDTHNVRGLSEMCLGDRASARRDFERSLALDPAQPPIREALRLIRGLG